MYVKKDYSYINNNRMTLIKKGYGKLTVHSINFNRHYSEEQKEENCQIAKSMTDAEWSKHCEDVARGFSKSLNDILKHFVDKYDVHQVSDRCV